MWIIGFSFGLDSWAPRSWRLKVMFFGSLGEKLGREVEIDPPQGTDTIALLRAVLADKFPAASSELLNRSRACIADAIVGDSHKLTGAESVEFFPPLSGG